MMGQCFLVGSPISCLCYDLYKMEWLKRIPIEMQMDKQKTWYEEEVKPNLRTIFNPYDGSSDIANEGMDFEDWLFETNGYEGFGLYAPYDEFLTNEFQDAEHMRELLDNAKLYLEYLREVAA